MSAEDVFGLSLVETAALVTEFKRRYDTVLIVYGNDHDTGDEQATYEFRDKGSSFMLLGIASHRVDKFQECIRSSMESRLGD